METKTSTTKGRTRRGGRWADLLEPGPLLFGILGILGLIFIFENTRNTKIRLWIPEVIMPVWLALLITGAIGFLVASYFFGKRHQ
jgi:uncharacterized integral membrane protein